MDDAHLSPPYTGSSPSTTTGSNQYELLSPEWWLVRLAQRLADEQPELARLERYYRGDHDMPSMPRGMDRRYLGPYRDIIRQSVANFMRLVADSTKERLTVTGFRLSSESDPVADRESWRIWQANDMDAESQLAIGDALSKRRSYVSVWAGDEYPTIAVEDARQVTVENYPGTRRARAAALKVWLDDWTGTQRADVYLPDGVYRFHRRAAEYETPSERWAPLPQDEYLPTPVPGVVPVVPIVNHREVGPWGQSEFEDVIRIQDRINGTIFSRVLAGWFTAFRQRWATGLEVPTDPVTQQPVEPFRAAIDRLWIAEDQGTKFGEFGATDLGPYLAAHERDLQDIAVITRTPRHYLFQSGQSPSGDALASAEAGLVAKCVATQVVYGEALEDVMRLARRFAGEPDAPVDSEIVWADAAYRSEAVRTDAVIKQYQAGLITTTTAQQMLGYTDTEIARMANERTAEALQRQGIELAELVTGSLQPPPEPVPA